MYNHYFGFSQNPFSITPNPAFLYLSPCHQEALSHLLYGIGQGGGFVALTGEVGTGKTTLIRTVLEQELDNIEVALCLNPQLTATEFVANICDELGIDYGQEPSLKALIDSLNQYLLKAHAAGKRVVCIIDEAQQLSRDVLEEIRLLTNLETANDKLLRIILVGQPELQAMLARNDLRQLSQRITARSHISPLNAKDTSAYVRHRIRVAGGHPDIFTASALRRLYALSKGIPRVINVLCERSLMGAYGREQRRVTRAIVNQAAAESLGVRSWNQKPLWLALAVLLTAAAAISGWKFGQQPQLADSAVTAVQNTDNAEAKPAPMAIANADHLAQQLKRQWKLDGDGVTRGTLCKQLQTNIECLSGKGNWRLLQLYDRPALLTVNLADGLSEILLLSIQQDTATVLAGNGAHQLPVNQLLGLWNGEFTLLYYNSSGSRFIDPGEQSNSVAWLRHRMSMADGLPVIQGPQAQRYDSALRERVINFQSHYGIDPDGLVGGQTLALLDNLSPNPATPRLILEPR